MAENSAIKARLARALENEGVRAAFRFIEENDGATLALQKKIALTESPTFHEERRSELVAAYFAELGLACVTHDEIGNVSGVLRGGGEGCAAVEAHMDTVFPFGTAKEVAKRDGKLFCPGISDDARGLAALLTIAEAFVKCGVKPQKDIIFIATVREEGIGGCAGISYFLEKHPEVESCLSIDGPDANVVVCGGPGIRTRSVVYRGRGGHAYVAYGKNGNPVHAAIRAMSRLTALELPKKPKTTFSVTNFHAGTEAGIHAMPPEAELKITYRSESMDELRRLDRLADEVLARGAEEENARCEARDITYEVTEHVDIPAALMAEDSEIVTSMCHVIRALGMTPVIDKNCPTNASAAMGKNIPAICVGGGGRAGANHSAGEWFDPTEGYLGVQAAFLQLVMTAGIAL